jgi:hypothetical protein
MTSPQSWTRAVRQSCVKQRESTGSQKRLLSHRPGVLGGWPAYEDRDRTRAIERWGISQDVNAESSIDITHTLELEIHDLSLSLIQHFLFKTRLFQIEPQYRTHFFLSFSRCTTSFVSQTPFTKQIFAWLNITKELFLQFTSKSDKCQITFKTLNNQEDTNYHLLASALARLASFHSRRVPAQKHIISLQLLLMNMKFESWCINDCCWETYEVQSQHTWIRRHMETQSDGRESRTTIDGDVISQ